MGNYTGKAFQVSKDPSRIEKQLWDNTNAMGGKISMDIVRGPYISLLLQMYQVLMISQ